MRKILSTCSAALIASGCASADVLRAQPVLMRDEKQICIIENPRVRADFLQAYQKALELNGYAVAVIPPASALGACAVTSKYVAYWNWDLVPYLSHAEIDVYQDGKPAGRAIFQARSRFGDSNEKVAELVRKLYR